MFLHVSLLRRFVFVAFTMTVFSSFLILTPLTSYATHEPGHELSGEEKREQYNKTASGETDSGGSFFRPILDILLQVSLAISTFCLQFAFFILGIFGVLLDVSLLFTFNMGAYLSPGTAMGQAISAAWTVFRDLANLLLIAGMVWASIAMILQIQVPGGSVGKFIANIIIAALLINFSYFFTGVIIDAFIEQNTAVRLA